MLSMEQQKLLRLIDECILGEEDSIAEAQELRWESQSDNPEHQRATEFILYWTNMRIKAAKERLEWLQEQYKDVANRKA